MKIRTDFVTNSSSSSFIVNLLIETEEEKYLIARTTGDVPDIDGIAYIKYNSSKEDSRDITEFKNKFVKCKIIDIKDYDLIAEIL